MRFSILISLCIAVPCVAQQPPSRQKALNNYMEYANRSAAGITAVMRSYIDYYPDLRRQLEHPSGLSLRYDCPMQVEEYYYNEALKGKDALPATLAQPVHARLTALRAAADNVDAVCKKLEVYHKLQDYKRDNYAGAQQLVADMPALLMTYTQAREAFVKEVITAYHKLQPEVAGNPYQQAVHKMQEELRNEKAFIDLWSYNIEASVYTGWVGDKLENSILDTERLLEALDKMPAGIKYPASSMYASFKENVYVILDVKRTALDHYHAGSTRSDQYTNEVYLDLINYYNGTLVSFYNSFIQYARQDFFGLPVASYVPVFSIRREAQTFPLDTQPYQEVASQPLSVMHQPAPVTPSAAAALNHYVDYVNECVRQSELFRQVIANLNSSARYYRGLTSFQGKGGLQHKYTDYALPYSIYLQAKQAGAALPSGCAQVLNAQAETLLNILKEIEQLSVALETETATKQYEKDHLDHLYQVFERYNVLFLTLDDKKEKLYQDVRSVYDSYPEKDPENRWNVSWKALRKLMDYDHTALFQAKDFYRKKTTAKPGTQTIDQQLRDVLTNEYTNMKGIEKYGRNNGLCPYTPYEDLPETSRRFSEKLQNMTLSKTSSYSHPYHDLVYLYNEGVDDFNKFTELSKLPLLKTVRQPGLFEVSYPEQQPNTGEAAIAKTTPEAAGDKTTARPERRTPKGPKTDVVHDTVYIEKRDTVYLSAEGDYSRSMEGYASNNLVLLLDVSGSMNAPDKLPLLKTAVLDLLSMMREEDEVAIVIYSGKASVLLPPVSFKNEEKIRKAIDNLTSSGKTDGNAGIKLAFQVADKNYVRGGNNRIILATDGEFPISDKTTELVSNASRQDIFLSVFDFGKATTAGGLKKLCEAGHGNYEHITRENMEQRLIREVKSKKKH